MRSPNRLMDKHLANLGDGNLEWIGLRPQRKQAMIETRQVEAVAGLGLEGDRRMAGRSGSARQVTIISAEFVNCIRQHMQLDGLEPALLRRNLMVSGINLNALRYRQFRIGGAIFEATALCHPCSRMESALGKGGFAAMMGLGGLCARVLEGGTITVGDAVIPLPVSQ